MSCEMHLGATLEGIDKFLCHSTSGDNDKDEEKINHTLLDYKIALSPTGEILVFATSRWLLICGSKWNSSVTNDTKIKYTPNWHGHLQCKIGEEITSLVCLPFFSHGQSIQGGADWTCIVVGFSSGYLRFYTEGMLELACSILHEEPITSIKCHNPSLIQLGKTLKQDNNDIYVVYKTVICILNGPNLCQLLLNKRNQLAKGVSASSNDTDNYVSVDFKKYSFSNQEAVSDACFLGQSLTHQTFDHLVNVSLIGGFSRISPPQRSLIVTSGKRPFVGFQFTFESGNTPVLSDVALAVASKIKSSVTATLPDWLGFGSKKSSQTDKPKEVAPDYAEKLNCRFGLCDLWRQGQSVILSPDGSYSAVSDSLGRIFLIDNRTGIALRLWKGFRDAQCGFYQVDEDIHKGKHAKNVKIKTRPRRGLFIIIYAPKKGLIEIFSIQSGQRVTSFKVTKFGRLLYNPRGCLVSNITSGFGLGQNMVVFISADGLHDFSIPFHCCLAENNSIMLKDLHNLKQIQIFVKTNSNSPNFLEDIEKCANNLKTNEVKFQAIEFLLKSKNSTLESLKSILNIFMNSLQNEDQSEPSFQKIMALANTAQNLLSFYEFLTQAKSNSVASDAKQDESYEAVSYLEEELLVPKKDIEMLMQFIEQIQAIEGEKKTNAKVVFEEEKLNDLGKFLSRFDFELFVKNIDQPGNKKMQNNLHNKLSLKLNTTDKNFDVLEETLFKKVFDSDLQINEWVLLVEKCSLNPSDLALCLLSFWCNKIILKDVSIKIVIFIKILKAICSLSDADAMTVEYNVESPWWSQLRSFIATNLSSVNSLFAALGCRCVTVLMEQEKELTFKKGDKKNFSCKEWETISKDTFQWDILITQLQDVTLLNAILSLSLNEKRISFSKKRKSSVLPKVPFDFEYQCLNSIQSKGNGRVSELVARWLCQFGFDPNDFIDKNDLEFKAFENKIEEEEEMKFENSNLVMELNKAKSVREKKHDTNLPLNYFALLKIRFPYSLASSSLLSNLCWEYIASWFKNMGEIDYLIAAKRCLEIIPSNKVKSGLSYLCWSTYLEQQFNDIAKMMNKLGKVPKICNQSQRLDQIPEFLKLIGEFLNLMLCMEEEAKPDFDTNREAIWQNGSTAISSSLVSIAASQPIVNCDLVLLKLQLSTSLLLVAGLDVKNPKIFSTLFDNSDILSFDLTKAQVVVEKNCSTALKKSRNRFLQKAITAAVQNIYIVENIRPSLDSTYDDKVVPSTRLDVGEYKKWLQICFDLAEVWEIPFDDLRRHQICELYLNGFDRLAEEVIPSINETQILASQLLVLIGKRLKYRIQDSKNLSNQMANLSFNLSEWLKSLDLENFKPSNEKIEDIEVIARYIIKWLPEGHADQNLAFAIIESLTAVGTP